LEMVFGLGLAAGLRGGLAAGLRGDLAAGLGDSLGGLGGLNGGLAVERLGAREVSSLPNSSSLSLSSNPSPNKLLGLSFMGTTSNRT
jgi:hypothetical protein